MYGGGEVSCELSPVVELKCSHHKKIYLKQFCNNLGIAPSYHYGLFSVNSFKNVDVRTRSSTYKNSLIFTSRVGSS